MATMRAFDGVAYYVVHATGGITACMYQGRTNVAECFIFGGISGATVTSKALKEAVKAALGL